MRDPTCEDLCHGVRTPLTTIANAANIILYRLDTRAGAGAPVGDLRSLVETILVEVRRADRRVLDTAWALADAPPHVEVVVRFDPVSPVPGDGRG